MLRMGLRRKCNNIERHNGGRFCHAMVLNGCIIAVKSQLIVKIPRSCYSDTLAACKCTAMVLMFSKEKYMES